MIRKKVIPKKRYKMLYSYIRKNGHPMPWQQAKRLGAGPIFWLNVKKVYEGKRVFPLRYFFNGKRLVREVLRSEEALYRRICDLHPADTLDKYDKMIIRANCLEKFRKRSTAAMNKR